MQAALCLTIPGLNGSDEDHWQSWAEREIPNCRRVQGIDFDRPVVAAWADAIRQAVKAAPGNVILLACIPSQPLNIPGVLVASSNDPWMSLPSAEQWANLWGLRLISLGNAGHINSAAGFGRWPMVHQLIEQLRENASRLPLGEFEPRKSSMKNRFSALIKARRFTRDAIQS